MPCCIPMGFLCVAKKSLKTNFREDALMPFRRPRAQHKNTFNGNSVYDFAIKGLWQESNIYVRAIIVQQFKDIKTEYSFPLRTRRFMRVAQITCRPDFIN